MQCFEKISKKGEPATKSCSKLVMIGKDTTIDLKSWFSLAGSVVFFMDWSAIVFSVFQLRIYVQEYQYHVQHKNQTQQIAHDNVFLQ
jgi:hypothetical protein